MIGLTCEQCGRAIVRYCHSQAGALKAYAWTDELIGGDPRDGTTCPAHGDWPWVHVPDWAAWIPGTPADAATL